jgi:hypothetical protein
MFSLYHLFTDRRRCVLYVYNVSSLSEWCSVRLAMLEIKRCATNQTMRHDKLLASMVPLSITPLLRATRCNVGRQHALI